MKILFMCVANSARSQMAEGLAREIFGSRAEIQSAGSRPTQVNPFAVRAMNEVGIDISQHSSKTYDQLPPSFLVDLTYIVTLCAEEVCPTMASRTAKKLHWPFPDPAGQEGSEDEQLRRFREVRDQLKQRLLQFAQNSN